MLLKNKQGDGHQEPKPEPTAALEILSKKSTINTPLI
jgi:hypothetical protein